MTARRRTLLAVLLNPPSASSGARTRNAVALAGQILGFDNVEIANLTNVATPTVVELNRIDQDGWFEARDELRVRLRGADALLGGWGTTGLHGPARRSLLTQVSWLAQESSAAGMPEMWTVGGQPRHPSRWHQYVSDKYGRATGATFHHRLSQVLMIRPFEAEYERNPSANNRDR